MTALHVACVNVQNYQGRGAAYVERLRQGVRQYCQVPHTFHCLDDDANAVDTPGWWAKILLFRDGLFPAGDRVLYFDLDTLIVGDIGPLAAYDGEFAMLRDFYRPMRKASGVMAWRAGAAGFVFDRWGASGMPMPTGGDQAWIEACMPNADLLQELFPRRIVSYKSDCAEGLPSGASVVCFHGKPKPHDCGGWAQEAWECGC